MSAGPEISISGPVLFWYGSSVTRTRRPCEVIEDGANDGQQESKYIDHGRDARVTATHLPFDMPILTKRWDDPIDAKADGTRILITRYRPRALPKEKETWTEWIADLGPSKDLHAAYYKKIGNGITWDQYRIAYLREMRDQKPLINLLAQRHAAGETITLLCSSQCVRESRCHRSLLKELIEKAAQSSPESA